MHLQSPFDIDPMINLATGSARSSDGRISYRIPCQPSRTLITSNLDVIPWNFTTAWPCGIEIVWSFNATGGCINDLIWFGREHSPNNLRSRQGILDEIQHSLLQIKVFARVYPHLKVFLTILWRLPYLSSDNLTQKEINRDMLRVNLSSKWLRWLTGPQ